MRRFDVIIVGYGFVGVMVVGLFVSWGWKVVVIDCMIDVYFLFWVVNFDGEIMCLFQEMGLVEDLIQ